MMLGEKQMMEVLILDQGTVQYRSVSSPPLASHWWAVTSYTNKRGWRAGFIKRIVPVFDSVRLRHVPSCCKILYQHKAVNALQQYNCASQTKCFEMSDFVVIFDLLGGLSLDEWWTEMDRMEEEE